jgi:5-methylcytosine-specific restriction endonuclease McrA
MEQKKCEVCGKKIISGRSDKQYCSRKCQCKLSYLRRKKYYQNYWHSKLKESSFKKCDFCGNEFSTKRDVKVTCSVRCSKLLWKKKNVNYCRKYNTDWQRSDRKKRPELYRFRSKNRRHLRRQTSGSGKTFSSTFSLNNWVEIKKSQRYMCNDCGLKKKLTIDHIYPLSKGGHHNKKNIQALCHSCNSRKKDKIISLSHTSYPNHAKWRVAVVKSAPSPLV